MFNLLFKSNSQYLTTSFSKFNSIYFSLSYKNQTFLKSEFNYYIFYY